MPIGCPSIRTTGMTPFVAEVRKASRAAFASAIVKRRSMQGMFSRFRRSSSVVRVTPHRISWETGWVISAPWASTIQALEEAPSVT